jgi:hypothetical protein
VQVLDGDGRQVGCVDLAHVLSPRSQRRRMTQAVPPADADRNGGVSRRTRTMLFAGVFVLGVVIYKVTRHRRSVVAQPACNSTLRTYHWITQNDRPQPDPRRIKVDRQRHRVGRRSGAVAGISLN